MEGSVVKSTRLRFKEFDHLTQPNGRCRARVVLELNPETDFEGESEGLSSPTGQLRCAAQASVNALTRAVGDEDFELELLGVKAVKAFDAVVVIVSLASHGPESARLIGSCLTNDDPPRGAALAVLNATNRFLGNVFYAR